MNIKNNQEYLEGEDPEYDINDLNCIDINKEEGSYQTSAFTSQTQFQKAKLQELEEKYEKLLKIMKINSLQQKKKITMKIMIKNLI